MNQEQRASICEVLKRGGLAPPDHHLEHNGSRPADGGDGGLCHPLKRDRLAREGFFDLHKKGPPRAVAAEGP